MIKKQKSGQKPAHKSSTAKDLFQSTAVTPVSNTKKSSEYGKQLREKQKVKNMYGVREKQFRRFFSLAKKSKDGKSADVRALINRYGATKLSDIKQDDYSDVMQEAEAM